MSNLRERDVPEKLVEDVMGTCDSQASGIPHVKCQGCENWKPIAPNDPAEGFEEWFNRPDVGGGVFGSTDTAYVSILRQVARAAWIASAEAAQKALATQK